MRKRRTSTEIRQQFIDFFVRKYRHTFVPSSPVVPLDDPTLMFTNAGMNQFKPIFLGQRAADVDQWPGVVPGLPTRAANTQKCIRAGGKHNDLDDVGHDTYHHTFFEMLGNWSFGDYFKKEAIEWAWELLTEVWRIDPERLHATYFGGTPTHNSPSPAALQPDLESRDLWLRILPPDHVHPGSMKDNFWEMGDTGPCGPCSEIHIDLTPDKSGGPLVNAGDPRVIELWNLVFIQFNRGPDGALTPLPARHVDTGMGFERLCAVLHGMDLEQVGRVSNYDTDVFAPLFGVIQRITGAPPYTGLVEDAPSPTPASQIEPSASSAPPHDRQSIASPPFQGGASGGIPRHDAIMKDVAYRVIADHLRCLTFAIADGATPGNDGRGYVLRRILRRAVRYGRQYLVARTSTPSQPFLCELVPAVVDLMDEAFPDLRNHTRRVIDVIREEELSFSRTLDRGIALFNDAAEHARRHHHGRIRGEDAFKLHDTYGFPIDLTELMAEEQGLTVDIGEYERLMEEARAQARATQSPATEVLHDPRWLAALQRRGRPTIFRGYTELITEHATVEEVFVGPSLASSMQIRAGESGALILDKTPFYAEQGGQVGDIGTISCDTGAFEVTNTRKVSDRHIHFGRCLTGSICARNVGELAPGESGNEMRPFTGTNICLARAIVNCERRRQIVSNHSSTHLLNWALREVLGDHVQQKGSLVDPDKTRFDFSHSAQLTDEQLARIESLVNERIESDLPVYAREVPQKEALRIRGLRAVFGEKYPDVVRVVSIGAPITEDDAKSARESGASQTDWLLRDPQNPRWMQYSVEFCGGTHVKTTAEIRRPDLMEVTDAHRPDAMEATNVRRPEANDSTIAHRPNAYDSTNARGPDTEHVANARRPGSPPTRRHFILVEESAVARGIRRVTGVTGERAAAAERAAAELAREFENLDAVLQTANQSRDREGAVPPAVTAAAALAEFEKRFAAADLPVLDRNRLREKLAALQDQLKHLEKQRAKARAGDLLARVDAFIAAAPRAGQTALVAADVGDASPDELRTACDSIRAKAGSAAVLLAARHDGKVVLLAAITHDLVQKGLKAGDLIRETAPLVGGKGGGRPDLAQGGGTDLAQIAAAVARATDWLRARLS